MKKILVVDNNPVFLALMTKFLSGHGYQVMAAESGLSAIEILKDFRPDVIFLDLILYDISGEKLCRMIREIPELKDVYVIIITAVAAEGGIDFIKFGANACIAKSRFDKMSENILSTLERLNTLKPAEAIRQIIGIEDVSARDIVRELNSVKKHLEIVISSISDGLFEVTSEAVIVYANPAAVSIVGRPEHSLIASYFTEIFQETCREKISKIIKEAGSFRQLPGESFPLWNGNEISVNVLPLTAEEDKRIILITDMTARKRAESALHRAYINLEMRIQERTAELAATNKALQFELAERKQAEEALRISEEKYRNIFENTVEGIFQATPEGRFISVNPSLARILGYDSPEEVMEKVTDIPGQIYVRPERNADYMNQLRGKGRIRNFETQFYRKDGHAIWVSINARAVRDHEGRFRHHEGTVEDITERKKLEAQLLQAQKMEAIGTLAGGIAHDFNNLLMGIQGYTSLMLFDMETDHPHYQKLRNIEEQVKSGALLTRQMLGFARAGKYEVRTTDLREIVVKSSNMFGRTRKEITIHMKFDPHLWSIEADQEQIEQMLMNFYVNAWQAMPAGGDLYIILENVVLGEDYTRAFHVEPGRFIKLSITDTGVGMDENTKERIFEPFFTTKEMGRGTGLGLATAYGIIKGHGGIVNVHSKKGHGTTFNIYLPASDKETGTKPKHSDDIRKGRETILIIDDEETIITVQSEILKILGYCVLSATSGKEAADIYRARKEEIDLVIMDMIMPEMGGAELFELLKIINPGVKVILSSGYSMDGQAARIMEAGCRAFIQKPFSISDISKKIREVLDEGSSAGNP
ncbi:MAG: response regulator [Syntrophales bacterium]